MEDMRREGEELYLTVYGTKCQLLSVGMSVWLSENVFHGCDE
jgi:hypothetical protein